MKCLHKLTAYRELGKRTEKGRVGVSFTRPDGPCEEVLLPCGQCIACRVRKSREWALRCVHEASLFEENSFVTLTYDEENLPSDGSLVKAHHQNFIKAVRREFPVKKIRYFMCGEYGSVSLRPHYHFLFFGFDWPDKQSWCQSSGNQIWRSETLDLLWEKGYCWIGTVTFESAAYVARYCVKKVNGDKAVEQYVRDVDPETGELTMVVPEYIAMSRRPGVGKKWFDRFHGDLYKDFVTLDGKEYQLPKYYEVELERLDPERWNKMRSARKERIDDEIEGTLRSMSLETCLAARIDQLKRSI